MSQKRAKREKNAFGYQELIQHENATSARLLRPITTKICVEAPNLRVWDALSAQYKVGGFDYASVSDFPRLPSGEVKLIDPDELFTPATEIEIFFDYPVTTPAWLPFTNEAGFTRLSFFGAVYEGYVGIYAAEPDPGCIPPMINRSISTGPYGIWGYYIGDLYIEGITRLDDKRFQLLIGS